MEEVALACGPLSCRVLTYGGALRALTVPDRAGRPVDVALGFDSLEDYRNQDKYLGALVGRYANRIGGSRFTLEGQEYSLRANDGANHLHGGPEGFDKQVWTVEEFGGSSAVLSLVSPDGEEGYPGTLSVQVTYSLEGGALTIGYRAVCDRDTVFNPTNHTYFNLSGHGSGSVEGQYIRLYASHYTPTVPGSIPTGEIAPVDGTPMDLRAVQPIGARIGDKFDQLAMAGGYDHNWVLDPSRPSEEFALAWSPDTGISLHVSTDLPGVQFYTGNFVQGCPAGKGGAVYGNRHGFCLETQFFPDSPNHPEWGDVLLRPGRRYDYTTEYRFVRG